MRAPMWIALVFALAPGCKRKPAPAPAPPPAPDAAQNTPAPPPPEPEAIRLDLFGDTLPRGAIARLGSLRMLERGVRTMVFSADGKRLYSNTAKGFAIWDGEQAGRLHDLPLPDAFWPLAITPDETVMATAQLGGKIQLWNVAGKKPTENFQAHDKEISALCFLKADYLVSASEDGSVKGWRLIKGTREGEVLASGSSPVTALACDPGGKLLMWGMQDGAIYWLDPSDPNWQRGIGTVSKQVTAVAIAGDGTQVAAASADTNIYTWPRRVGGLAGKPVVIPAHDKTVTSLAFKRDGRTLFSAGGDAYFREWNTQTGALVRDISGISGLDAQYLALSPDGRRMVSWSSYSVARGTEAGRFWLWDVQTGELLEEPDRHSDALTSVAVALEGDRIATGSLDGTVRIWSAQTGKELGRSLDHEGRVQVVEFGPGGEVWSAGEDARMHVWNPEDNKTRSPLEPVGGEVMTFDVSRTAPLVATGDRTGKVWLFDLDSGKKLRGEDRKLFSEINEVAFSPGGQELAIAGSDNTILVTDLKSGREVAKLRPQVTSNLSAAFSPDKGRLLATGTSDHEVHLWTTDPWAPKGKLTGHDGGVRTVAWSPDGRYLASGGNDRTIRLWDVQTETTVAVLEGHDGAVTDLAFAPDQSFLVSVSDDRTGLVWRLHTRKQSGQIGQGILDKVEAEPAPGATDRAGRLR